MEEQQEHLKLSSLLSTNDEIDWITNLLLVNQSYHILNHFNYMKRISSGSTEKFQKVHQRMEKERLEILNGLLNLKKTYATTSNASSNPDTGEEGPKRRGPKPKPKLPSIGDLINNEIQ